LFPSGPFSIEPLPYPIKEGEPEWDILGIPHLRELPALQGKLMNIREMTKSKRDAALERLKATLQL